MTKDPGSGGDSVSSDEVLTQLKMNTVGLLPRRTEMLESMHSTRGARERGLQRERQRLAVRLPADSPRLAELDARIQESRAMSVALEQQIYQAKTPFPTPDPATWLVFGSVRDGSHKGLPGLSIAFYDDRGMRRDDLGYTCTDTNGYFTVKGIPNASNKGNVHLRVHDSSGNMLYNDSIPMTPRLGGVEYREIIIDGKGTCAPPREQPGQGPPVNPPGQGPTEPPPTVKPSSQRGSGELFWTIRGRVSGPDGTPSAGMVVTLWDKDLWFDDKLGQAETNEKGEYELVYSADAFRDLFERKPDVYVRVTDRSGKRRGQTKKMYRPEAGQVEIIDITLNK